MIVVSGIASGMPRHHQHRAAHLRAHQRRAYGALRRCAGMARVMAGAWQTYRGVRIAA